MSLFDDIKARFSGGAAYYDERDAAYDEYEDFDERDEELYEEAYERGFRSSQLPHRSNAESVTVVSRAKNQSAERAPRFAGAPRSFAAQNYRDYDSYAETSPATSERFHLSAKSSVYILKAESYDQAELIARELKAGHPVALSLLYVRVDLAKRLLDFSFGACCVLGGRVEKLAEKVFVLLPGLQGLSAADKEKLRDAGLMPRN